MGYYQKNLSDFSTSAIELQESKTLKAAGLSNLSTNTIANLPASSSAIVYATGGTYPGAATLTTIATPRGVGLGATFLVTSDGAGAVASITVQNQGPNVGVAAQTIEFSLASLELAFGVTGLTGALTATLAGGDLERPSGTFVTKMPSLYVGGAGNIKLTLASDEQPIIIKGITANSFLPIAVKRVFNLTSDTETTATDILALF
tara:strand:- start:2653 stop:3264 length:612 start_codon:yes stop_codon:yes gene_type:complete